MNEVSNIVCEAETKSSSICKQNNVLHLGQKGYAWVVILAKFCAVRLPQV